MKYFVKTIIISIFFISSLSYSGWFGKSKCDELEDFMYMVVEEKDNGLTHEQGMKELDLYFKNKDPNNIDFIENAFKKGILKVFFEGMYIEGGHSFISNKIKSASEYMINLRVKGCKDGAFDKQFNQVGIDSFDVDDLKLNAYPNGQTKQEKKYDRDKIVITRWYENGQKTLRVNIGRKNEKPHGMAKGWYINGQIAEIGNYINGKKDGKFEWWNIDGKRVEVSNYKKDKLRGKLELWHENGTKFVTTNFINGEVEGEYNSWYDNGEKAQNYFIKNGMLNGLHTLWHDNGEKAFIVNYLNNVIDFEKKLTIYAWKKNGDRLMEAELDINSLNGFFYAWHKNGQKMVTDNGGGFEYNLYKNGQKYYTKKYDPSDLTLEYDDDGEYSSWHKNGEKLFNGSILKNKIHGDFVLYYDNGEVKYSGTAINGKIKGELKSYYFNGKVMNTDWETAYHDIWEELVTKPSRVFKALYESVLNNYKKLDDKVSEMEDKASKYIEDYKLQYTDDLKNYTQITENDSKYIDIISVDKGYNSNNKGKNTESKDQSLFSDRYKNALKAKAGYKIYTGWYEDGQKKSEGYYKDGKADGQWTSWYESGQKKVENNYKDFKREGKAYAWYENGQLRIEANYINDKRHGDRSTWHENGQKKVESYYKDGELTFLIETDKYGKIIK